VVVYRKGADPDALDRAAGHLDAFAGECRAARAAVDQAVGVLDTAWGGRDHESFRGHWRSSAPSIDALERALHGLGTRLRENAAKQRGASTHGGSGGGSGGGGGAGAGGGGPLGGVVPLSLEPSPATPPAPPGPQPPATTGIGGPVDGYDFGEPDRPDIEWDEGFAYDSEDSNWRDHLARLEWLAKLEGGRIIDADLDDATAMYAHYWDNNGEPIRFDYEEGVKEDSSIAANVSAEIARTAAAVDAMVGNGNTFFSLTGDAHPATAYPETENWQKTIGGYQQWRRHRGGRSGVHAGHGARRGLLQLQPRPVRHRHRCGRQRERPLHRDRVGPAVPLERRRDAYDHVAGRLAAGEHRRGLG
jgi:uncharacterized protein YukE